MKDSQSRKAKAAYHINLLSQLLGAYSVAFGGALFIVGLFTDPVILVGSFIHITAGVLFLLFKNGITKGVYHSGRALAGLSLTIVIGCVIAIGYLLITEENIIAAIYLGIILVLNLAVLWETRVWLSLVVKNKITDVK